ncbi:M91 family zinc metallopeptidase [Rugamonas rivuli]|uniref:Uncharacterized protein n=1 Tax=Rugamonas rivuli TaxID=2743358 RepID=A0A843S265_9BURK|nr:M91 family zinc metallopeptidase [Rugamonas rivuli]MQA18199.1 hypothetical protein [Rugamonas rivuli]
MAITRTKFGIGIEDDFKLDHETMALVRSDFLGRVLRDLDDIYKYKTGKLLLVYIQGEIEAGKSVTIKANKRRENQQIRGARRAIRVAPPPNRGPSSASTATSSGPASSFNTPGLLRSSESSSSSSADALPGPRSTLGVFALSHPSPESSSTTVVTSSGSAPSLTDSSPSEVSLSLITETKAAMAKESSAIYYSEGRTWSEDKDQTGGSGARKIRRVLCVDYDPCNANYAFDTPSWLVLAHELIHALHYLTGSAVDGETDFDGERVKNEEMSTVGLGAWKGNVFTENRLRKEAGLRDRPRYSRSAPHLVQTKVQSTSSSSSI